MNYDKISRIALVTSQLRRGGAERVVVHLAREFHRRNLSPLVVCIQEKGELAAELEAEGVDVIALRSLKGYDLPAVFRLARVFRKFKPDVINVHDYSSLPYVVIAGLARRKCPIVLTSHGLLYEGFERQQRRLHFFSRGISTIAAVSPQVRDRHVQYLDWRGTTHLVRNGVVDRYHQGGNHRAALRKELGIGENEFVFLAVGNPRPEKAFEDLIAASIQVQQTSVDRRFSVLIAGQLSENEYCNRLRQLANTSGLQGLRLLGYRDDVQNLYSAADAFVISSRSEGLPLVLLEAMTMGLPVVATRVGGIPDAVPSGCGLLVHPGQPDQLASGMISLFAGGKAVCEPMGKAARDWALQEFGIDRMIQRYLEVYSSVARQIIPR